MVTVVKAMAQADSGLEIRDRMWLKITIPNAFIGKISTVFTHHDAKYVLTTLLIAAIVILLIC